MRVYSLPMNCRLSSMRKNAGTPVAEGGFSRPAEATSFRASAPVYPFILLMRFRDHDFVQIQPFAFPCKMPTTRRVKLGLKPNGFFPLNGRLKPPSATVVPTF